MQKFGLENVDLFGNTLGNCRNKHLKKLQILSDKRWNQEIKNDFINGSSSEYDSSDCESEFSGASVATFDRMMDQDTQLNTNEIIDKDMELMQPYIPEDFDKPMKAPGDLQSFRCFHQWVPSSFDDSQLPKDIYVCIFNLCYFDNDLHVIYKCELNIKLFKLKIPQ